jgi:HlyD family secretion protein
LATEIQHHTNELNEQEQYPTVPAVAMQEAGGFDEIISRRLPFIIRWGTLLFLAMLLLIGGIAWFIRYPDLVPTKGRLMAVHAPKEILAKTDGRLTSLLVQNNDAVQAGQLLGSIESIASPDAVAEIHMMLDSFHQWLTAGNTIAVIGYYDSLNRTTSAGKLGELQNAFQTFMQSFSTFNNYINSGFYVQKRQMLLTDLQHINEQKTSLQEQFAIQQEDVALAEETFSANEKLAKNKVLSPLEYRTEQSKWLLKKLSLPQLKSSMIANEAQRNEKLKEIATLDNDIEVQRALFVQALQNMRSQILNWKLQYLFVASTSGKVQFASFLQEGQQLKSGMPFCSIQPANTSYYIEAVLPQHNFGKVNAGQKVLIKFLGYPYEQFGSVTGKVGTINPVGTDSGFLAKIILPQGLQTNRQQTLLYQNGLLANAEIITDDRRLLERMISELYKTLQRE